MSKNAQSGNAPAQDAGLEEVLGYHFQDPAMLQLALTHSSLAYERSPERNATTPKIESSPDEHNEQLEFIGDAVIGLIVAESLYRSHPHLREGDLTRLRAALVSRKHLAEVAVRLNLGSYLYLGKGEERSGGRKKPALLANAMEAVLAALYLDGGLLAAAAFAEKHVLAPTLPGLTAALHEGEKFGGDHKSALQEHLQAHGLGQARYNVTAESGPDHRKHFSVEVSLTQSEAQGRPLATATGKTKKEAQQAAARLAYDLLRGKESRPGKSKKGTL